MSENRKRILESEDLGQVEDFSPTPATDAANFGSGLQDENPTVDSSSDEPFGPSGLESTMDAPTIDELLEGFEAEVNDGDDKASDDDDLADTGTYQAIEVLLDPEELFSKGDFEGES